MMASLLRSTSLSCASMLAAALLAIPCTASPRGPGLVCEQAELEDDPAIISAKTDASRGRVWILAQDGLYLHQSTSGAVRRFDLPHWRYVIRFACPPDLAVAPDGSVVVSSNVTASLWRVDPALTPASQLTLRVVARAGREFGFSAIDASEPGFVWARSASDASRWRIDLETGFAAPLPPEDLRH